MGLFVLNSLFLLSVGYVYFENLFASFSIFSIIFISIAFLVNSIAVKHNIKSVIIKSLAFNLIFFLIYTLIIYFERNLSPYSRIILMQAALYSTIIYFTYDLILNCRRYKELNKNNFLLEEIIGLKNNWSKHYILFLFISTIIYTIYIAYTTYVNMYIYTNNKMNLLSVIYLLLIFLEQILYFFITFFISLTLIERCKYLIFISPVIVFFISIAISVWSMFLLSTLGVIFIGMHDSNSIKDIIYLNIVAMLVFSIVIFAYDFFTFLKRKINLVLK